MKRLQKAQTELLIEIEDALSRLTEHRCLLDAYLYRSRNKCGRKNCKCMDSDYRHEAQCLSFTENGKSRTRTVDDEDLEEIQSLTTAYRDLRKTRKQLSVRWKRLMTAIDSDMNSSLRRGRKRFENLMKAKVNRND